MIFSRKHFKLAGGLQPKKENVEKRGCENYKTKQNFENNKQTKTK